MLGLIPKFMISIYNGLWYAAEQIHDKPCETSSKCGVSIKLLIYY